MHQAHGGLATLLRLALGGTATCVLFVLFWAGTNYAFGTALDGPIGAAVMEPACQRLEGTTESLKRYSLGTGRVKPSSSVCHFASGPVRVDGPTAGLGFTEREFVYLLIGFLGYGICFVGAFGLAVASVRGVWRLLLSAPRKSRPRDGPTS